MESGINCVLSRKWLAKMSMESSGMMIDVMAAVMAITDNDTIPCIVSFTQS